MIAHGPSTAARDDAEPGAGAWFAIVVLLLLTILSYLDRSILALMIGPIEADLHIDDVQMSLLQGLAFALFYSVATVPMGWVSDRVSRPAVIFSGAALWSVATVACGLARSFGQLFAARVAVGAGEATLSPAAYALAADLFPPRRLTLAIGILAAGSAIGAALAFIVGGLVVSWAETVPPVLGLRPWQLVFVIVGLPGLLVAPLVFLIPRPGHHVAAADPLAPTPRYGRWLLAHLGYILPLSLGVGCQTALAYGLTGWMPAYFQRHFGYDVAAAGLTLGLVQGAGGIVGFVGGGWLVDRLGAARIARPASKYMVASALLTMMVGVVCFSSTSIPAVLVAMGLLYLVMPVTGPSVAQLQAFTPRRYRGRTVALFMLIFNVIGMVFGPTSVAMLTQYVAGGPEYLGQGMRLAVLAFGPLALVSFLVAGRAARRLEAGRAPGAGIGETV